MRGNREGDRYSDLYWVKGNAEINNIEVTVTYWKDVRRRGYYLLLHGQMTEPKGQSGTIVSTCMLMTPKNPPALLLEETNRLNKKRLFELAQLAWGNVTGQVHTLEDLPQAAMLRALSLWEVHPGEAPEWWQG